LNKDLGHCDQIVTAKGHERALHARDVEGTCSDCEWSGVEWSE
jgi:hypothetical protein